MNPEKEKQLFELADDWKSKPFVWGERDCSLFASSVIDIITEGDLTSRFYKAWTTGVEARRYSLKNKITVESYLVEQGAKEIKIGFQQTGDFILMDKQVTAKRKWRTTAVCLGKDAAVITEEMGLIFVPFILLEDVALILRLN